MYGLGAFSHPDPKLSPLVKLWILRILVRLHAHRKFLRKDEFDNEAMATALGFEGLVRDPEAFNAPVILERIRNMHLRAERNAARLRPSAVMAGNINRLAKMLELSPADCTILTFAVLVHVEESLDDAADWLGLMSTTRMLRTLARILDLPLRTVKASLGPQGILTRSGLISISRHGSATLRDKLDLLSSSFSDQLASTRMEPIQLLRGTVSLAPKADLTEPDYAHLEESLNILNPYLEHAVSTGHRGVNVFLHGPPGTGKTQLARLLAGKLKCKLFEVSSEDDDGDPVDGERRLRALRASQTLLSRQRAMILFDEVEDVFDDGSLLLGQKSTAQKFKAWINRMLEDASVPTFWLSNWIDGVDPAFLRRFDMIIEVPVPPRNQRERIVRSACSDLVGEGCIGRLAESDRLAPAVITRASSVMRAISPRLGPGELEPALEHLIGNTLEAQGHRRLLHDDPCRLPDTYDVALLNPDTDILKMAEGLKKSRYGRICMYGPPGTGKTAFGRWLAEQLGIPLHVKRASDLLGPYVGMTERNIAKAFREAEQLRALFLLDEVDSFLRDRRDARQSWEATQVNEMLTQMESFPGIFIASTNLMDGLDQAALRRFDIKIRMGYLRKEQALQLLRSHLYRMGLGEPCPEDERALVQLANLAPGDYAAIARQHRFNPVASAGEFVSLLAAECQLKGGARRPIGFVH